MFLKSLCAVIVSIFISGCAGPKRQNMTIDEAIFSKKPKIIITQIEEFKSRYIKTGEQGLLDVMVSACAMGNDEAALKTIDTKKIIDEYYYKLFEKTFKEKGAKVAISTSPVHKKNLHKMDAKLIHLSPYDISFLSGKNKHVYALVLEPSSFGIIRPYYGFIPTGSPNGYAAFSVYLIQLEDNTLLGYFEVNTHGNITKTFPIKGYSGHSPEEIVEGAKFALKESLLEAHTFLTTFY